MFRSSSQSENKVSFGCPPSNVSCTTFVLSSCFPRNCGLSLWLSFVAFSGLQNGIASKKFKGWIEGDLCKVFIFLLDSTAKFSKGSAQILGLLFSITLGN